MRAVRRRVWRAFHALMHCHSVDTMPAELQERRG